MSVADKVFSVICKVLNCPRDSFNEDSPLDSLENWDSLKYLSLVLTIEEEMGMKFSEDEVVGFNSPRDIIKTIENKSN